MHKVKYGRLHLFKMKYTILSDAVYPKPCRFYYSRFITCYLEIFIRVFLLLFSELIRPSVVKYEISEISLSIPYGGRRKRSEKLFRGQTHFEV